MKHAARVSVVVFAIVAVIVILVFWKRADRAQAIGELEQRYEAQISINGDEFYLGCSSPRLETLEELAALAKRVGDPTILDLTGASSLRSLAGAEQLPGLVSIVAIDCPALASLEGVEGHPSLRELVFTDSAALSDASSVRGLPLLRTLDFSGCASLVSLGISDLPSLENLYLSRCRGLRQIDMASFPELRQLYVDGCTDLESIAGIESLSRLTDLDLSNAASLKGLPDVAGLDELVVLDVRSVQIENYSGIASLPKLRVLRMGGQENIETLEPLEPLASLRELHLEACPNLRSLRGMPAGLSQYAGFTRCPRLASLGGIEAAAQLEQLDLTGCENLEDVSAVATLPGLMQLSLAKCPKVVEIGAVAELPKLVIVMLGGSGVPPDAVDALEPRNAELIFDFSVAE